MKNTATAAKANVRLVVDPGGDPVAIARTLGPDFAARAAGADEGDRFVAENYAALKDSGLVGAAVPQELGGLGADFRQLSEMLRTLAHSCGSTALAFAMHTHVVAAAAWRWTHEKAPVDGLLKRVAAERLIMLSSGGSDWLQGSGTATRAEGGWRINARKIFASGAPAGDLFMTMAVANEPGGKPEVLHFAVPMKAPGVRIDNNWHTLGMRGTGSHDVVFEDVFVADAAISGRRTPSAWHPMFHIVSKHAFPLVFAVYLGVAEAARDRVVEALRKRPADDLALDVLGHIENELAAARLAVADMVEAGAEAAPGFATTHRIMTGRTLAARGVLAVVDLALDAAGGRAYFRNAELERLFRDAQASRYHPLRAPLQRRYAAQMALGIEPTAA